MLRSSPPEALRDGAGATTPASDQRRSAHDMAGNDSGSATISLLSSELTSIFRDELYNSILRDRIVVTYRKGQFIYDPISAGESLFFIRRGFVKIGTVAEDGHEMIYDVRKTGDVVGELCAISQPRHDYAVALESSLVVPVPFDEVISVAQTDYRVLRQLVQSLSTSLYDSYEQLNSVAFNSSAQRLIQTLVKLGKRTGRASGQRIKVPIYLTQKEIAQMSVLSRERVSTTLNCLRGCGLIEYSRNGHLILDLPALENAALQGSRCA